MMNQLRADFIMNPKPPTIYSILNAMANFGNENKVKKRELAKATHERVFDFDYVLSDAMAKDEFEINILNHYMMRRINYDTFTAFQLYLENKLNEILPYYNIIMDSFKDYNLFNSGEVITRETIDNRNIDSEGNSKSDSRFSEYPLNQLTDITDGSYVSNQTTINSDTKNNTTDKNTTNENIKRTPTDKMQIYKTYLETKQSVMSMIYKELDSLFYGLVD